VQASTIVFKIIQRVDLLTAGSAHLLTIALILDSRTTILLARLLRRPESHDCKLM
jgi:hypothetical protein